MSKPKLISEVLKETELLLDKLSTNIPIVDNNDPDFIRQEILFKLQREKEMFLEDLKLARIPIKHFRILKSMKNDDIPALYNKVISTMKDSLLLHGNGKPKTLAACAWLANRYRKGDTIFYVKGLSLLLEASNYKNRDKSRMLMRALNCGSLVIDDIQNINNSDINLSHFSNILSERSDAERKTILISSSSPTSSIVTRCAYENVEDALAVS